MQVDWQGDAREVLERRFRLGDNEVSLNNLPLGLNHRADVLKLSRCNYLPEPVVEQEKLNEK
jgi:hypothetical protein